MRSRVRERRTHGSVRGLRREPLVYSTVGQRRSSMNDLKELGKLMKEHPVIIVVTLAAMVVGAIFGAAAFYQGWLG